MTTARVLKFENKKYTEEDFVIPAQDTKGHSERAYCRVPPGFLRDMKVIISSRRFPFRTMGDIQRLAIKLVIELLKELEPIPSVSGQVDAIIRIVRDEEFHQEFLGAFEQVGKTINRYMGEGQEPQARRMLVMVRDEIKQMPKGYWRTKYWKELNAKYAHLMRGAGMKLDDGVDEDAADEDDLK
jgi:hypothetical protein